MSRTILSSFDCTVIRILLTVGMMAAEPIFAQDKGATGAGLDEVPYNNYGCFQCHGYAGQGSGAGAQLVPLRYPYEVFRQLVRKPYGSMPPYSPRVLSDEVLKDIFEHLGKMPGPVPVREIEILLEAQKG